MTDSALFWLKRFNIDGFRHDATKHIPLIFWRELTKKVKSQVSGPNSKSILQIGETYGSRELISSYISSGMLDGQFDFNLYDDAVATFAREDIPFSRLTNSLKESINYYGDHNLMGYITGNQDRARFISYADGSVRFDEDSKKAGWTRKIEIQDTNAYSKLASLTAFMMTIPGIPVIYYGDEIGIPGGNDPDNRRMMNFDNLDKNQLAHLAQIKKVTQLRKTNLALIYGDMEIIKETDNFLVIRRNYFEKSVTALFNKSAESIVLNANDLGVNGSDFKSLIQDIEIDLNKISVNAFSFDMISN
jgi:glycosidase